MVSGLGAVEACRRVVSMRGAQILSFNGAHCEHLAFRSPGVNWEIWIELRSAPFPGAWW
jgi:hypothetical protein